MIKRMGIMLVMMLNIILLFHIGMPHHHHQHVPYFTSIPQAQHEDKSCCSHNEEQQTPVTENGCCVLDESYIAVRGQQNKTECNVCLHQHPRYLAQAVLLAIYYDFSIKENEGIPIQSPPYINNYLSIPVSSCSGLRAPPFC
jgi:hypothetical protein